MGGGDAKPSINPQKLKKNDNLNVFKGFGHSKTKKIQNLNIFKGFEVLKRSDPLKHSEI